MRMNQGFKRFVMVGAVSAVALLAGTWTQAVTASADDAQAVTQTTNHAASDQVVFEDAGLEKTIAKSLGVSGPVTYGDIRQYSGKQLALPSSTIVTSLKGMESLRELPAGVGMSISLDVKQGVSVTPLSGLTVSGSFTLIQNGMHSYTDDEIAALNSLHIIKDPNDYYFRQLGLGAQVNMAGQNYTGLDNADLEKLKPLFASFAAQPRANGEGVRYNLCYQQITDFSFFKQFGRVEIIAVDQYQVFWNNHVYIDPATFTSDTVVRVPSGLKGLNGEALQPSTHTFNNPSGTFEKVGTDALVSGVTANSKWIYLDHYYKHAGYPDLDPDPLLYPDGSSLIVDGAQYYPIVWDKAPEESSSSSSSSSSSEESSSSTDTSSTSSVETSSATSSSETGSQTTPPTTPDSNATETSSTESTTSSTSSVTTGSAADTVEKGTVVYAIKPIYLYQRPNFKVKERVAKYVKQPRINRPMFVVTGYARSTTGHLRYLVRDVNHQSATAGKTGYVTAKTTYTVPVYYQSAPKKITVIGSTGVNAYRKVALTGKARHYRQGTVLDVVGIKRHNLTTRFVLRNGQLITANRKLVIAGTQAMPSAIKTKTAVNRYKTANLTGKNGHYVAGKTLKVLGWTYSKATDFNTPGALRYRVAGGYVTANQAFVTAIK